MADFIKQSVLKNYITNTEKTRINKTAFTNLIKQINSLTQSVIKQSKQLATENRRTTIMPKDIAEAIEKLIARKHLPWEELSSLLIQLGPIELGNISKAIDEYIEKHKE